MFIQNFQILATKQLILHGFGKKKKKKKTFQNGQK